MEHSFKIGSSLLKKPTQSGNFTIVIFSKKFDPAYYLRKLSLTGLTMHEPELS